MSASVGDLAYHEYTFPSWMNYLGWSISCLSMSLIPLYAIYKLVSTPGTLKEVTDAHKYVCLYTMYTFETQNFIISAENSDQHIASVGAWRHQKRKNCETISRKKKIAFTIFIEYGTCTCTRTGLHVCTCMFNIYILSGQPLHRLLRFVRQKQRWGISVETIFFAEIKQT